MLRIHVLSDLHLEFGPMHIPAVEADVLILAGDIDLGVKGLLSVPDISQGNTFGGNHDRVFRT